MAFITGYIRSRRVRPCVIILFLMAMTRVAIVKVDGDCSSGIERAMGMVGLEPVKRGDTVLIKPNLVEPAAPDSGQVTSLRVIEGTVCYCRDHGARRVIIGEGPGYYQPETCLRECFTMTGVDELARRLGVEWVLFDEHPFRHIRGVPGVTPDDFRVTRFVFECDCLINLPVLKTHYLTGVTLAMKNLKGCLKREDKPRFHWYDLSRAVVELCRIIRPQVNVIDATARHVVRQLGSGYNVEDRMAGGGLLIVGSDIVAVDAVGSALMGLDPAGVRMIQEGARAGLGEASLARIEIVGEQLKRLKFRVRLPQDELQRFFPELRLLGADNACSGCLLPLTYELLAMGEQGARLEGPLVIFLGKNPGLDSRQADVVVGDCAVGSQAIGTFRVAGCPPSRAELRRELLRYLRRF